MKAIKGLVKITLGVILLPVVVVYQICLIIIQLFVAGLLYIAMRRTAKKWGVDNFNFKINWIKK